MQANAAVANAYVADITAARGAGSSRFRSCLGAMFGIGFILGPAMGGAPRGHIDLHLPFVRGRHAGPRQSGSTAVSSSRNRCPRDRSARPSAWRSRQPARLLSEGALRIRGGVGRLVGRDRAAPGSRRAFTMHTCWVLYATFTVLAGGSRANGLLTLCRHRRGLGVIVQGATCSSTLLRHGSAHAASSRGPGSRLGFHCWPMRCRPRPTQGWMMYVGGLRFNVLGFRLSTFGHPEHLISEAAADERSQGPDAAGAAVAALNSLTGRARAADHRRRLARDGLPP
jgi:DHA1 family tetracycline resistance protein-like MFS transporter